MKRLIVSSLIIVFVFSAVAFGQTKTKINSNYAKNRLLGRHFLSLQWISWKHLGRAYVKRRNGVYSLKGSQKSRKGSDSLEIDGVITEINRYNFKFNGTITTKVSHQKGGEACVREGEMTFAITKRRKYWRLQEMKNPCDASTDYIDIYFRK